MGSADLTRYAVELGSRNSTTGWRDIDHSTSSTIRGAIFQKGSNPFQGIAGAFSTYAHSGYFADLVAEGDVIKDELNYYFYTRTIPTFEVLDQHQGYFPCEMEKLQNYPEASVTPATPDEDDPRYRTRVWLNDRLSLSNDWAAVYAYPDYPLQYEFTGENVDGGDSVDVLYCVGHPDTTPLLTHNYYAYGFREKVPITIAVLQQYTQDNTQKLLWAAEDALRTVCRDYPLGSVRTVDVIRDRTERHGNETIAMRECTINYKRSAEYVTTYPRVTWGPSASPTGTYYFPNCVDIQYSSMTTDAKSHPPSFVGDIKQPQGAGPLRIKIICDLDIENSTYTWMRPQTSTPKTDNMNWQVLADIDHNGGIDEAYQTLTLDWGNMKVRQQSYRVYKLGDDSMLEVVYEEYTNTDQSGNSLATRWTIT